MEELVFIRSYATNISRGVSSLLSSLLTFPATFPSFDVNVAGTKLSEVLVGSRTADMDMTATIELPGTVVMTRLIAVREDHAREKVATEELESDWVQWTLIDRQSLVGFL